MNEPFSKITRIILFLRYSILWSNLKRYRCDFNKNNLVHMSNITRPERVMYLLICKCITYSIVSYHLHYLNVTDMELTKLILKYYNEQYDLINHKVFRHVRYEIFKSYNGKVVFIFAIVYNDDKHDNGFTKYLCPGIKYACQFW